MVVAAAAVLISSLDDLMDCCNEINELLEGYYDLQSDWVLAASVLDPRLNVKFFEDPDVTDIENAEKIANVVAEVKEFFLNFYGDNEQTILSEDDDDESTHSIDDNRHQSKSTIINEDDLDQSTSVFRRMFKKQKIHDQSNQRNVQQKPKKSLESVFDAEMANYCNRPLEMDTCDILMWWKFHKSSFPLLSKLAKDVLAVCATSVPSERAFSSSKHVTTDLRNRLKEEIIEDLMLAKSFYKSTTSKST